MPPVLPEPLRSQRRRLRIVYSTVVGVLVLAAALTMGLVIGTGEAANATLTTSAAAGPVPAGAVSGSPSVVWSTTDRPAEGDPLWVGTVITWSEHQLTGRDAVTGDVRWSYRRADATVCDAAQQGGLAFVLFRIDGNCDEISAFDAGTGARNWFRTLADDGEGRMTFSQGGLVLIYPQSFHVLYPAGPSPGIERYNSALQPADCTITSAAAGDQGVLITEQCHDGAHLAMYDYLGTKGDPRISFRMSVAASIRAVDAGSYATTFDQATGQLTQRALDTGAVIASPALSPTPTGQAGTTTSTANTTVLQLGERLYGIARTGGADWSLDDAVGPAEPVDRTASELLVATTTGATRIGTATGTSTADYRFGPPVDGSRVYVAGNGLIVAGTGLAYLR